MNTYRIKFEAFRPWAGEKKISDIKDFRELTRNPFTGLCATLTFSKDFIERLYINESLELEVTAPVAAHMLSNWMNNSFCPHGWSIVGAKPVIKVEDPMVVSYDPI